MRDKQYKLATNVLVNEKPTIRKRAIQPSKYVSYKGFKMAIKLKK